MSARSDRTLVWDLPTRVFHWLLAATFAGAYLTAEGERLRDVHMLLGYSAAGLVTFRVLWGVVGTRYARFTSFPLSPRAVFDYLKSLLSFSPRHYFGHNPAGSWAILGMLALIAGTALTGWANAIEIGPKWMEDVHEVFANATLALIVVHVGAVIVSSLLHRENLPRAMVTGYKPGSGPAAAGTRWFVAVALVAADRRLLGRRHSRARPRARQVDRAGGNAAFGRRRYRQAATPRRRLMRLLLVEDDAMLGSALRAGLRQDGHAVDWVRSADEASTAWIVGKPATYDAVVLDLGLPDGSGLDLLRRARQRRVATPVLIATARDRVADRIAGLDAGADDYMVKPIDLDELAARLRAIERRVTGRAEAAVIVDDVAIDPTTRSVTRGGAWVDLTARELAVLLALAKRPGVTCSREQLIEALYGWEESIESNAIDVHIHHLRRKLGSSVIETQRGLGWRLATGGRG